jgi:hypothetical protein
MEDKIVTFESYYDPMLAHIVRTRLEANGISCFVADESTFGASPLYNQAAGGIKLKIFEKDMEKCREILATEGDLHDEDRFEIDNETNTYVVCPYCASTNVSNIAEEKGKEDLFNSLINLVSPFHAPKNWRCNNCQQEFE